jgi:hypothetical protein
MSWKKLRPDIFESGPLRIVGWEALALDEVVLMRRGACRVERRMLKQPDALWFRALGDRVHMRVHARHRIGIGDQPLGDLPHDFVCRCERQAYIVACSHGRFSQFRSSPATV